MKQVIDNRTKAQDLWTEMRDYMNEAGARVNRVKITGSKAKPLANVYLPYDGRLAEQGNSIPCADETSEEQSIRISKDKELATIILRGYGFVRTKNPAFASRIDQAVMIPYVFNPEPQ